MSKTTDALRVLSDEAAKWQAVIDLLPSLRKYGSLEQAEKEVNDRLAKAKAEVTDLEGRASAHKVAITKSQNDLDIQKATTQAAVDDATKRAAGVENGAERRAHEMIELATAEGKKIIAAAQAEAKAIADEGHSDIGKLTAQIAKLTRERDDVAAQVNGKRAALDKINGERRAALQALG